MAVGVDVIIVAPGAVATPIWDKVEDPEDPRYRGTVWAAPVKKLATYMLAEGPKGLAPAKLGAVILEALTAAKPKARYAPVPGKFANFTVPRLLPKRWLDRLIAGQLGLRAG